MLIQKGTLVFFFLCERIVSAWCYLRKYLLRFFIHYEEKVLWLMRSVLSNKISGIHLSIYTEHDFTTNF